MRNKFSPARFYCNPFDFHFHHFLRSSQPGLQTVNLSLMIRCPYLSQATFHGHCTNLVTLNISATSHHLPLSCDQNLPPRYALLVHLSAVYWTAHINLPLTLCNVNSLVFWFHLWAVLLHLVSCTSVTPDHATKQSLGVFEEYTIIIVIISIHTPLLHKTWPLLFHSVTNLACPPRWQPTFYLLSVMLLLSFYPLSDVSSNPLAVLEIHFSYPPLSLHMLSAHPNSTGISCIYQVPLVVCWNCIILCTLSPAVSLNSQWHYIWCHWNRKIKFRCCLTSPKSLCLCDVVNTI